MLTTREIVTGDKINSLGGASKAVKNRHNSAGGTSEAVESQMKLLTHSTICDFVNK